MNISKPVDGPALVTICGDAGLGKTSLAASFPKPIFMRAEDGLQSISHDKRPDAFDVIETDAQVWEQFKYLISEKHDYKTLVIDSVTALERLFTQAIVDGDPKAPRTINQALGGYGAGLAALGAMHQRVRKAAGILNSKRGMHVVFIGHADTETITLPDEDAYTRYSLRLGKKSVAPYVDDVNLVGFMKLETFTTGDGDRKKAISDGTRVLICYATAANISKNRYGITEPIVVQQGVNPLAKYLPGLNNKEESKT
jgi:hypothetical protein